MAGPEQQDDDAPPWWSVRKGRAAKDAEDDYAAPEPPEQPAPPPMPPGLTITYAPPTPAPDPHAARAAERLYRARRWLAYHGLAAGLGWMLGLGPLWRGFLADMGRGGGAAGLVMAFLTYTGGETAMHHAGRFIPQRLHPAARLITRIPFATLALAIALNTPNAL